MARDITVTFDDGSSHVYQNAPDDITPEAVQERAQKEFKKGVTALDGGRKPTATEQAPAPAPTTRPSLLTPLPIPQEPTSREGESLFPRLLGKTIGTPVDYVLGSVADVPLQVAAGGAGAFKSIVDYFGAGSAAGKALESTQDYLIGLTSAQSKNDSKEIARIMKDAEDKGFLDQLMAAAKAFTVAPVDLVASGFGSIAPVVLTTAATILSGGSALAATAGSLGLGAVMGGGTVKGSIYDATKAILKEKTKLSDAEIEKAAEQAQAYNGENLDNILIGMGLGAASARTGAEAILARSLAKGAAKSEATKAAVSQATKEATEKAAAAGVKKNAIMKGGEEFITETAQAGQEKFAQNIAEQRQGFDTPTMRGVVGQGVLEGLAGTAMGAYAGGREAYKAKYEVAKDKGESEKTEEEKTFMDPSDVSTVKTSQKDQTDEQKALLTSSVASNGAPPANVDEIEPAPIDDKTTNAQKYMDEVDATGKKNQSKLKKIVSDLGINVEVGKGFNERAITAIKAKLAEGAPSATTTESVKPTDRDGTKLAVPPEDITKTGDESAAGSDTDRVVSDGTAIRPAVVGETPQSLALKELKAKREALTQQRHKVLGGTDKLPSPKSKKGVALAALNAQAMEMDNEIQKAEAALSGLQTTTAPVDIREDVYSRVSKVEDLLAVYPLNDIRIRTAINELNQIEKQNGIPLSKFDENGLLDEGDVLSAKGEGKPKNVKQWLQEFMKTGVADPRLVAVQQDTTPAFQIDPNATADENLKGAMELGKLYEDQEKAASETAYNESLSGSELKYNAQQELKQTEAEAFYGMQPRIGGAISAENRANYEKMREEFPTLPAWDKLNADDKDVYFGDMRYGNLPEHRKAAEALLAHRTAIGSREAGYDKKKKFTGPLTPENQAKLLAELEANEKAASPSGRRIILNYEANRRTASKMYGVKFPRWGDLSPLARKAYVQEVINNAGLQHDRAYAAAAEQIILEREGDTKQTEKEIQSVRERQAQVRKDSEKAAKDLAKLQQDYARVVKYDTKTGSGSLKLSNTVIEHITNGRLNAALSEIAESIDKSADPLRKPSAGKKMMAYIAKLLLNLNIKTTIQVKPYLSNGDLGQYDPYADSIALSQMGGLTVPTLLHEVSHAGTVRVMNMYMSSGQIGRDGKPLPNLRKQLTESQIKGVEQILKIMRQAQAELRIDYPDAFESPFEFIAYAMNDRFFQADLAQLGYDYADVRAFDVRAFNSAFATEDITSILPKDSSLWSKFKSAIAGIFKTPKGAMQSNNFMLQLSAAFEDILSVPTGGIDLGKLSAKQAEDIEATVETASGIIDAENNPRYKLGVNELPKYAKTIWETLTTNAGWRKIAGWVQNRRYEAKHRQFQAEAAGKLIRDLGLNFNNYYDQSIRSAAQAEMFFISRLQAPMETLRSSIHDFAKTMKLSAEDAVARLHAAVELFHEPERRFVKWMMSVPLSNDQTLMHNGKPISPAERREQILGDRLKGKPGIIDQVELTQDQMLALRQELEMLTGGRLVQNKDGTFDFQKSGGYVDAKGGKSPNGTKTEEFYAIDFNVLGIGKPDIDKRRKELEGFTPEQRAAVDKVLESVRTITKESAELDKIGNYWSYPVSNLVGIYGFNYYLPFKGKKNVTQSAIEQAYDLEGAKNGKELQQYQQSMGGRFSTSANPLLQVMSDATRAASRAGMRNLTKSIMNALPKSENNPDGTGIIAGEVKERYPFSERDNIPIEKLKGENSIVHYESDGSIVILEIHNKELLSAIRHTFQDANSLLDMSNRITGFFGRMHTRYNYDFPLLNFARDALTNAWTIGAKYGPMKSIKLITEMATQITARNGMYKAMMVSALHDKGDAISVRELQKLEKDDPYVKDMLDYIREGSKTTYLSGFSLKSQIEELDRGLGKGRIATTAEQAGKILDVWTNMFEFASRTAAFSLLRDQFFKEYTEKHPEWSKERAMNEARQRAFAETKELANFESVGEYGRMLGGIYMFIRASATGAAAAIEATAPAFRRDLNGLVDQLPPGIRDDPVAVEKFLAEYKERQKNARIMVTALAGFGAAMYVLSMASADDDEWKRNSTAVDNMQQWTRFARFHIPSSVSKALGLGENVVFQIPWGFGLGSFASMGAQVAAMGFGNQSVKDGLANMFSSVMDSYVPIPISKMPVSEEPLNWAMDTIMPSVLRPFYEYNVNKNGIGQAINSASNRRMADAFTGGDRIPEMYKDAARYIFNNTGGEWDVGPNTLYFFANSYLDGVSRVAQQQYNMQIADERDFTPKNDLPLLGSFFGAKSNVDSREFGKAEEKIKEIVKKLNSLEKADPEARYKYFENHPMHRSIIDIYDDNKSDLDDLRERANEIRDKRNLPMKDRQALLQINIFYQNKLKRRMLDKFEAYGLND
jgi:hypothetical protein